MPMRSPHDFFVYHLSVVHSAEQTIAQSLSQIEQVCQNQQRRPANGL